MPARLAATVLLACAALACAVARAEEDHYGTFYPFRVLTENHGRESHVILHNDGASPVYVKLSLTQQENVDARGWPLFIQLPPRTRLAAATLQARDPQRRYHFRYWYDYQFGDVRAKHDDRVVYRVPMGSSQFLITQAYPPRMGDSHDNGYSRHAIDVDMPIGTPILAARGGEVVQAVQHWDEGRFDKAYLYKSNLVRVLHDDGTLAEYLHLLKNSVTVRVGTRVNAGDPIGRSGNSGYSARPHLHFGVARAQANDIAHASVAIRFRLKDGREYTPRVGDRLSGY